MSDNLSFVGVNREICEESEIESEIVPKPEINSTDVPKSPVEPTMSYSEVEAQIVETGISDLAIERLRKKNEANKIFSMKS